MESHEAKLRRWQGLPQAQQGLSSEQRLVWLQVPLPALQLGRRTWPADGRAALKESEDGHRRLRPRGRVRDGAAMAVVVGLTLRCLAGMGAGYPSEILPPRREWSPLLLMLDGKVAAQQE